MIRFYSRRRLNVSILVFIFASLLFITRSSHRLASSETWRSVPQVIGLGEWVPYDDDVNDSRRTTSGEQGHGQDESLVKDPDNSSSSTISNRPFQFTPGQAKSSGSNYTKAVVLGHTKDEDVSWLTTANLPSTIHSYIYSVDSSPLSPSSSHQATHLTLPQNKGHEAMIYLTYIIDHYSRDLLSDISIFLHAHRTAWHNPELLNHDSLEIISRISSERVTREGYMNVRCHWKPGCPSWIHPGVVTPDKDRPEEGVIAGAWALLFPGEPIPAEIGSPCCAQFAVSRDRILSVPLESYVRYRDWLAATPLRDSLSGRVFEYLWSYIFTGQPQFCPDHRVCLCDGYGVCFEDVNDFEYWFELNSKRVELDKELTRWREQVEWLEMVRKAHGGGGSSSAKSGMEEVDVEIPVVDEDVRIQKKVDELMVEMTERRKVAMKAGRDPQVRARVAGREWKVGDGF